MAWSTAFEKLMPATVQVAALTGLSTDGYGTPTYGSASTHKARVVGKQHLIRTFDGVEETARTMVWVASTSTFAPSAQFTLPDGTTPELLAVTAYPDSDGTHHVRLSFA